METWLSKNYKYYFKNGAFPTIYDSIKAIVKRLFYWEPKHLWSLLNYSGNNRYCSLCKLYQGDKPFRLWSGEFQEGLLKAKYYLICHYNPRWVEYYRKLGFERHGIDFVFGNIHLNPYHRNCYGDCEYFVISLTFKILRSLLTKVRNFQFFLFQRIYV